MFAAFLGTSHYLSPEGGGGGGMGGLPKVKLPPTPKAEARRLG